MSVCEVCGEQLEHAVDANGIIMTAPRKCRCERDEEERVAKLQRERDKAARMRKSVVRCFGFNCAPRTFGDDDGMNAKVSDVSRRYVDRFNDVDFGLLFFGACDQGKTFLCECIASSLLSAGYDVIMRSVPEIVRIAQKDGFDDWAEPYINCDLLILDDLGAERETSFAKEAVYSIVDSRYRRNAKMLVSTNLTRDELQAPKDVSCSRIYGRILERCLPVEFERIRKRSTRQNYDSMRAKLGL